MPEGEIQTLVMVQNKLYPREIHTYRNLLVEIDKLVNQLSTFIAIKGLIIDLIMKKIINISVK